MHHKVTKSFRKCSEDFSRAKYCTYWADKSRTTCHQHQTFNASHNCREKTCAGVCKRLLHEIFALAAEIGFVRT